MEAGKQGGVGLGIGAQESGQSQGLAHVLRLLLPRSLRTLRAVAGLGQVSIHLGEAGVLLHSCQVVWLLMGLLVGVFKSVVWCFFKDL